jgi:hypothetical protein
MRITIDTAVDTYDSALAALQAAFGVSPPPTAAPERIRVRFQGQAAELNDEGLPGGWTEQSLYLVLSDLKANAREVIRCVAENAPMITRADVVKLLRDDPARPTLRASQIGGTMTSLKRVLRRRDEDPLALLDRDYNASAYLMDVEVAAAVLNIMRLIDATDQHKETDGAADS